MNIVGIIIAITIVVSLAMFIRKFTETMEVEEFADEELQKTDEKIQEDGDKIASWILVVIVFSIIKLILYSISS